MLPVWLVARIMLYCINTIFPSGVFHRDEHWNDFIANAKLYTNGSISFTSLYSLPRLSLLKFQLVLCPHRSCYLISPCDCPFLFGCPRLPCCQLSWDKSWLQIDWFSKVCELLWVMNANEVVNSRKSHQNTCLKVHVDFSWIHKNAEASL